MLPEYLEFQKSIVTPAIEYYGLNSLELVKVVLFQDTEWGNIITLTSELVRTVILKSDRTVIDLGTKNQASSKIHISKLLQNDNKAHVNICKALLQSPYDAHFLEHECLSTLLELLKCLTSSKVFNFLPH